MATLSFAHSLATRNSPINRLSRFINREASYLTPGPFRANQLPTPWRRRRQASSPAVGHVVGGQSEYDFPQLDSAQGQLGLGIKEQRVGWVSLR